MIEIRDCDFTNQDDRKALISLMNHYMADTMGGALPSYTTNKALAMVDGLHKHPSKLILLASIEGEYCGLANSFINFSTFSAKPFVNIHDIVVLDKYRNKGIGRRLMEEIVRRARELGCSKITLEVREDNMLAQALYTHLDFKESVPAMHYWTKVL
jgi:ribosomal protein S18 acetylase RimI-like enzyme